MIFRILPEAEAEALRAAAWYDMQTPGKGDQFLDTLADAFRVIQRTPSAFARIWPRRLQGEFRVYDLTRFQYVVTYRVSFDDLAIVAVSHNSRQPFYWTRRFRRH